MTETYEQRREREAKERQKLIPAMREAFRFDQKSGKLVWAKTTGPKKKEGQEVGSLNQNGTRQVMFNFTRYVAHEIVYAITTGEWPRYRLAFRDGNPLNIRPENLFMKEDEA